MAGRFITMTPQLTILLVILSVTTRLLLVLLPMAVLFLTITPQLTILLVILSVTTLSGLQPMAGRFITGAQSVISRVILSVTTLQLQQKLVLATAVLFITMAPQLTILLVILSVTTLSGLQPMAGLFIITMVTQSVISRVILSVTTRLLQVLLPMAERFITVVAQSVI